MAATEAGGFPGVRLALESDEPSYHNNKANYQSPNVKTSWQKFVTFIWDHDHYDKSPMERKLVFKLDLALLSVLSFGWLMKYIDQTNLSNAYVSGMKEDLNILGNEYTWMNTIYNVVYCVMQIPSNFAVLRVRPSYYLTACEVGWTIFTFAQAGAQSTNQMYAFRFFVALFEAAFQPVSYFILGSWYTKAELAKRVSIWYIAGPLGQAFSGFMQAAIYQNMNGLAGFAGWRWLYIMCGIMTVPAAFGTFFFLPDFPENTQVWYLSEEEKEMAKARCAKNGTMPMEKILNFKVFRKVLKSWHFWVLVPTYVFYAFGIQNYNYTGIYLKAAGYDVTLRNILPAVGYLIGIPFQLLWGWLSDRTGSRFLWCFLPLVWGLCPTIILAIYPDGDAIKVFAFMITGSYFITHIFYTWVNEICHASMEERGFIIACTNTLFYAFNSWLPTIVFLQTDGPRFAKGYPTVLACNAAAIFCMVVIWILHKRQLRNEEAAGHGSIEEGEVEMADDKMSGEKARASVAVVNTL